MTFRNPAATSSKQGGFTLIEIIVVMVIIGILVTLSAGSFITSQQKGRDARRKGDLKQISNALEAYANDHPVSGSFTYPASDGSAQILGCGTAAAPTACPWGDPFQQRVTALTAFTVYMPQLPSDPKSPGIEYVYHAEDDWYILFARLENLEDPSISEVAGVNQVFEDYDCGSLKCNYAVSSSNIIPENEATLGVE